MSTRITDVTSAEFGALFTRFDHTADRWEGGQVYDVSYETVPYQAFLAGRPQPRDPAKSAWTAMLDAARITRKLVRRVHLVDEPLTDYLRYELGVSYPPNADAGEDIRILPADTIPGTTLARLRALKDYWLFDSSDAWVMDYDRDGRFLGIEQVTDPDVIVSLAYWRDAALHYSLPYADYMRRTELLAAS